MEQEEKAEISIINSIANDNTIEIASEIGELTLDQFMDDGILKEIPIIGSLYKTSKLVVGIRELLFAKKLYLFLSNLKSIPLEKRLTFVSKINENPKEKIKTGQRLILILEQLNDLDKPKIIANLFSAHIQEKITSEELYRLTSIVERAYLPDISSLEHFYFKHNFEKMDYLTSLGIIGINVYQPGSGTLQHGGTIQNPHISYVLNQLGISLLRYGFNYTGEINR